MKTTPDQIDLWRSVPSEHQRLEFKEAKQQFDNDKLYRYCVAIEVFQLPAPDFRVGHNRTIAILFGPRDFENMDREDRIRACYQHSALKWVMSERMTNQSLRDRFHLPESKSASVSQIIALSIEAGVIKLDEKAGASRKFARYLPYWA